MGRHKRTKVEDIETVKLNTSPTPEIFENAKKQFLMDKEVIVMEDTAMETNPVVKKQVKASGRFQAVNGVVYSPEGKVVSKQMDVVKAEDVASKFNRRTK